MRCPFLLQVALSAVLTLGCAAEPSEPSVSDSGAPTAAVLVVNERTHFIDLVARSLCTGEEIPTTGTVHEVLTITETGNGVVKLVAHLQIHAVGTSPTTGASLRFNTVVVDVFPDLSFPPEGTTEIVSMIIAKGSAPNELNRVKYHLTLNANGTITSFFDEFTTTCQ